MEWAEFPLFFGASFFFLLVLAQLGVLITWPYRMPEATSS